MRILHVSMLYPPHVMGGAERSVALLAEAQVAAGHEVIAACTTPGPFVEEERNGVRVFRMPHETRFWAEEWPKHNAFERLWRKAMMPFNKGLRRHFERVLDLVRPDIVHTHSMVDVSTSLWPAAAAKGYTVVHTLRDYDLLCVDGSMYHGGKGCGIKCQVLSAPKKQHHRHLSAVAAISHEAMHQHLEQKLFSTIPEQRRQIIWNSAHLAGTGPNYRRPDRSREPFTFGYLGRVTDDKGIGVLIEAVRRLPADVSCRVIVAGTSPVGLERFVAACAGLPIHFAGHSEPLPFFEGIDVLVVPSIWAEPFGRIIIEAYSAGVPVLASRAGGIPSLIAGDKDRWLIPPGDVHALSDRMTAILRAGRDGLPPPSNFDVILEQTRLDTMVLRYAAFYDAALGHDQTQGAR
ncbi:hypothetical protein WSK_0131 [Novosphingobium sp. Rr 2-17]|uniref:glycosyltransferase family 4 protein n=1 Tax=Novosphingobium sp. Rr 2-17 TaxID=555793 RepID=UPI0002697AEA|nr:glycosyltransferase family 4 protein [Novosphingobium sp. Rr 2-17]EIZ81186.1 hypothetical protein WSK_0131 [Novosphingobium sp. Rr 2-17]